MSLNICRSPQSARSSPAPRISNYSLIIRDMRFPIGYSLALQLKPLSKFGVCRPPRCVRPPPPAPRIYLIIRDMRFQSGIAYCSAFRLKHISEFGVCRPPRCVQFPPAPRMSNIRIRDMNMRPYRILLSLTTRILIYIRSPSPTSARATSPPLHANTFRLTCPLPLPLRIRIRIARIYLSWFSPIFLHSKLYTSNGGLSKIEVLPAQYLLLLVIFNTISK